MNEDPRWRRAPQLALLLYVGWLATATVACSKQPRATAKPEKPEAELALSCATVKPSYRRGEPLLLRIEISNRSIAPITVLGLSLPWKWFYAMRFEQIGGSQLRQALPVLSPPTVPDVTIAAGGSSTGQIDLSRHLVAEGERSVGELPGSYGVRGRLAARFARAGESPKRHDDYRVLELDCTFKLVVAAEPLPEAP